MPPPPPSRPALVSALRETLGAHGFHQASGDAGLGRASESTLKEAIRAWEAYPESFKDFPKTFRNRPILKE